jgi:hypothetical protein
MRLLTVAGVTLLLLLGAVPLAVPGVPRLPGIPAPVAAGALALAGVAFLAGIVFLLRGAHVRRRAEAAESPAEPMVPVPAPIPPAPVPSAPVAAAPVTPAPRPGLVAVRTRL